MVAFKLAYGIALGTGLMQPTLGAPTAAKALSIGTTWDYPLGYNLTAKTANASTTFYSVDLFNTAASDISALIAAGHFVACYFSAGSVESYRNDSSTFPAAAIGKTLDGYPDEKWVDTRNTDLRNVMQKRITWAKQKGCQGIDPDNIDGYENDTGFNLSEDDGISYIQFLSNSAKAAGMKVGLKNGGAIVDDVVSITDWEINEQCVRYNECDSFAPFVSAGKPVFHVEYTSSNSATSVDAATKAKYCGAGGQKGFSTIIKHLNLDKFVIYC